MTIEKFREGALKVLRDESRPVPVAARLEYIRRKAAEFGLTVNDTWLTGLLDEASGGMVVVIATALQGRPITPRRWTKSPGGHWVPRPWNAP